MTEKEQTIRRFFNVDSSSVFLRGFFSAVNDVLQDSEDGFDENAVEIINNLIAARMDFSGSSLGEDEEGNPRYMEVSGFSDRLSFCQSSDFAVKILNDPDYTMFKLQNEITSQIDSGNDDIMGELDWGYSCSC